MDKSVEQIMTENNIHNQLSIEQLLTCYGDKFNEFQLKEIRLGLENGINVSIYAKPEFEWEQMREIRWGIEDNLDVSLYAKPELSWTRMEQIRWKLEENC